MDSKVPEILEKAADLLESGNVRWTKNKGYLEMGDDAPMACAMGAIYLAANCAHRSVMDDKSIWMLSFQDIDDGEAVNQAEQLIRDNLPTIAGSFGARRSTVEEWNDDPERTLPEVVDFLKMRAKDARNIEGES